MYRMNINEKKYFYRQEFISGSYEPEEKFDSGEKELIEIIISRIIRTTSLSILFVLDPVWLFDLSSTLILACVTLSVELLYSGNK